jgi:hypothetical protein
LLFPPLHDPSCISKRIKHSRANNGSEFIKYLHIAHMTTKTNNGNKRRRRNFEAGESDPTSVCAWDEKGIRQWKLFAFPRSNICISVNQILLSCAPRNYLRAEKHFKRSKRLEAASRENAEKRLKCRDKIDTRRFKMSIQFRFSFLFSEIKINSSVHAPLRLPPPLDAWMRQGETRDGLE